MKDLNLAQDIVFDYSPSAVEKSKIIDTPVVKESVRWTQLDMARGIAILLMILSHCVKGMMAHTLIPDWGNIPIHLITKFSSSLFILVFGFSLSMYFLPHVQSKSWKKKRMWMIKRGVELMLWYKFLTVVQMFQFYPKGMIVDTLLFKSMPDFVEILCFYSIALIWIPFVLPLWSKVGFATKSFWALGMVLLGQWLHYNFNFWGLETLKAILVEHEGYYTFGQFQRGGIVFLGLLMGDLYKKSKESPVSQALFAKSCAVIGSLGLLSFYIFNSSHINKSLVLISKNVGKHPLEANFMSFSLGGAFLILGLCMLTNKELQKIIRPITYLGQNSLNAFILHIIIIFYFYRYFFGLHHKVSYLQSLGLTGACVALTIVLIYGWNKAKAVFA